MIHNIGQYMQMKNGIFKKVIPTLREGQEYPLTDINPTIENNQSETPTFWQHIEKAFLLSQDGSKFSTSTMRTLGDKIDGYSDRVKAILAEVEDQLSNDLTALFNEARDPYKPEVTGIKIAGFKDGKLFGTIGLDRALPVNDADLKLNRTVPFAEDEAETPAEIEPDNDVWSKID